MGTVNVNVPDGLQAEMDEYIEETGMYVNQSELVRDAIRRRIEERAQLSAESLRKIEQSKREIERGETFTVDEVREQLGLDDDSP